MLSASSVSWSPDGNYAISGTTEGEVFLWDLRDKQNPKEIKDLKGHTRPVASVSWSSDGKYAISGDTKGEVFLWDLRDKQKPKELALKGDTGPVYSVSFSPDGNYAISGSSDKTIKLWDLTNKQKPKELATLKGHTSTVSSVAFSPDGNYAISGSRDKTIKLWDLGFLRLTDYLLKLPDKPDGVLVYILLSSILVGKKQEDAKETLLMPFSISYKQLKDLFKSLPDVLKGSLIKEGYVKIK